MIGKNRSLAALFVALQTASTTDAFTPRALSLASPSTSGFSALQPSTVRLFSSLDDDELYKMLGKRSGIRRKSKEELPSEDAVDDDDFANDLLDDFDLDSDFVPDFKTTRKKRKPKKKDKDEDNDRDRCRDIGRNRNGDANGD